MLEQKMPQTHHEHEYEYEQGTLFDKAELEHLKANSSSGKIRQYASRRSACPNAII